MTEVVVVRRQGWCVLSICAVEGVMMKESFVSSVSGMAGVVSGRPVWLVSRRRSRVVRRTGDRTSSDV